MAEQLSVELDLEGITIGEVVRIEEWARGEVSTREVIEMLQARVTNGVDLMALPWSELAEIMRRVRASIFGGQGNS